MADYVGRDQGRLVEVISQQAGVPNLYVNRVWDAQKIEADKHVYWTNTGMAPDSEGTEYPGPGVWGVDTSNYRVISRTPFDQ